MECNFKKIVNKIKICLLKNGSFDECNEEENCILFRLNDLLNIIIKKWDNSLYSEPAISARL